MEPTDDRLVDETLDGDVEAFEALMRRYERLVFTVARGYGRSRENALDITQNVFLKVYRSLPGFRRESSFKTWLLRIAYNESANWVRRHGRHRGHESIDPSAEPHDGLPARDPSQESRILAGERIALVERHLGNLNARYRLAVELRYFQELSIREIAEVLECSEGVAKNMLFRSIRRLRDELVRAV